MKLMRAVLLILLASALPWQASAQAESRLALVMGNADYPTEPLRNPVHDAQLMAETLQKVGFSVTQIRNADLHAMRAGIEKFCEDVKRAGPGATAFFFYAGKGALAKGESLLLPLDIAAPDAHQLEGRAITVSSVFTNLKNAGAGWRILIVDAGREIIPVSGGAGSQQLLPVLGEEPDDERSAIAYSASPGSGASDGNGANSPYTVALSEAILKPGLPLDEVLQYARIETVLRTGQAQVPWDSMFYAEPFYFLQPQ